MIGMILQAISGFDAVVVTLFGLVVGSFLNVVIHRLPIMLERNWRQDCQHFLAGENAENSQLASPPYNLMWPGSHCPTCSRPIRLLENVPVLSYVALRGRCAGCGVNIHWRYPAVESMTACVALMVYLRFGWSLETLAALTLSFSLIALAWIDLEHYLLPDAIILPVLWLGLLLSLAPVFVDSHASILGAAAGYLSLWLVYQVFRLLTGKEGMGFGDFKLLALLGAWLGWTALPQIILLSSFSGAMIGILLIISRRQERGAPIPFGPYLALAGWITLLWGDVVGTAPVFGFWDSP